MYALIDGSYVFERHQRFVKKIFKNVKGKLLQGLGLAPSDYCFPVPHYH